MSAEDFILNAELREDQGKGASRRLRHANQVPGIIYGAGEEAVAIKVSHNELFHHLEHEAFYSHILTIKVGKKTEKGILKDLQRHPAKPLLLHFDILRVKAGEKLKTNVPLHFINEDNCVGVKAGGAISHLVTELEIECLPKDLPEFIEVDMANVEVGQAVHLTELVMPKGVAMVSHGELDAAHDHPVANVHEPKTVVVEDTAPEAPEAPEVAGETKDESED